MRVKYNYKSHNNKLLKIILNIKYLIITTNRNIISNGYICRDVRKDGNERVYVSIFSPSYTK